jgi:hypothetical protein
VLLVAMIGAIVLTLRAQAGVRRQNIAEQNAARPRTRRWTLRKVEQRQGAVRCQA